MPTRSRAHRARARGLQTDVTEICSASTTRPLISRWTLRSTHFPHDVHSAFLYQSFEITDLGFFSG
jgi:hypothetical protein